LILFSRNRKATEKWQNGNAKKRLGRTMNPPEESYHMVDIKFDRKEMTTATPPLVVT